MNSQNITMSPEEIALRLNYLGLIPEHFGTTASTVYVQGAIEKVGTRASEIISLFMENGLRDEARQDYHAPTSTPPSIHFAIDSFNQQKLFDLTQDYMPTVAGAGLLQQAAEAGKRVFEKQGDAGLYVLIESLFNTRSAGSGQDLVNGAAGLRNRLTGNVGVASQVEQLREQLGAARGGVVTR